ncbi:MAG: glycosyltransferase [Bacteroidetes bacterium]|nr:MAG: glycosyltransferase [Bacteroidota bacterium]
MSTPRISVIMPVYNAEKHLKEAIQSILNQTYTDFEFIIVDDGCTDKSQKIIKSIKDIRINLVVNEQNIGLTKSLLNGYTFCKGEFIARMDADDISVPLRFEKQLDFLDKHPEVGVLGTNALAIKENTKPLYKIKYPEFHSLIKWALIFSNPMCHPSVMMRRSVIEKFGFYESNTLWSQDYQYWSRIIDHTKFYNIQEYLILIRTSGEKVSLSHYEGQIQNAIKICKNNLSYYTDENLNENIIKGLWTWKYFFVSHAKIMIELLIKTLDKFTSINKLTEKEIILIKRDVVRRIQLIAITKIYSPLMILYIIRTLKLDKIGIFRTLWWGLTAIINKYMK